MTHQKEAKRPPRRRNCLPRAVIIAILLLPFLSSAGSPPEDYHQEGQASWYGKPFHGRKTASGATYNMYSYTCAHRSLPFGTRLRVTNLETGQSVIVTVTDRGPFIKGRIVDLSYSAARDIGMLGSGVAPVRIELESSPGPLPPPADEETQPGDTATPDALEDEIPLPPPLILREKITVLTFNIFDPFFGPDRASRVVAIPQAIAALQPRPDVILLLEAFESSHREFIVNELKRLKYPIAGAWYEKRQYGTGMFLISTYPIESHEFTPFNVSGAVYDPERWAGKGILHFRLTTPAGPLDLFASHPIARFKYLYDDQGRHVDRDRKTIDRLLQMEKIAQVLDEQDGPDTRSVMLIGDLNVSPDMWEYQYLLNRAGLVDSYSEVHPGEIGSTYSTENTFNDQDWSRIDHIFYRNRPGTRGMWLTPINAQICIRERIDIEGRKSCVSDHFGVLGTFEAVTVESEARLTPAPAKPAGDGARIAADIGPDSIRLTPLNAAAWQAWALGVMRSADQAYNRWDERVIPAARVIIAGEVKEPVAVPLSPAQRVLLRAGLVVE